MNEMASTNVKVNKSQMDETVRLAGGSGQLAAKQKETALLRRSVMSCLLWEDGVTIANNISTLMPSVSAVDVAAMAVEARFEQKLRHVPLFMVREMAKLDSHKHLVADTLSKVIHRPDELCEFLALYWKEGKKPISSQVKRGLAKAFTKFDEYQLAKWDKSGKSVSLKDVMRLVHPKANDEVQSAMWKRLIEGNLKTPDTWEVGLSAAKGVDEKCQVWVDLINRNKLGALAVLKNLRNMQEVGVPRDLIAKAITEANPSMLLPINFFSAAKHAPDYTRQIEQLMFNCAGQYKKLPGWTIMVIDVSGSMGQKVSNKSDFSRMDAGAAMAVLAAEMCENVIIYATAGNDRTHVHSTKKITPHRGFALAKEITKDTLGGGGIFTRQCIDYIRSQEKENPDRIIVFSDSQDCDSINLRTPKLFGKNNYIVDVSPHKNGVNYKGVWTAEISGWSESFLRYIAEFESTNLQ